MHFRYPSWNCQSYKLNRKVTKNSYYNFIATTKCSKKVDSSRMTNSVTNITKIIKEAWLCMFLAIPQWSHRIIPLTVTCTWIHLVLFLFTSSSVPSSVTTSLQMGFFVCYRGKQPVSGKLLDPFLYVFKVFQRQLGDAWDCVFNSSLAMQAEVAMFSKKNWKENMDIIQMFPSGVSIYKPLGSAPWLCSSREPFPLVWFIQ